MDTRISDNVNHGYIAGGNLYLGDVNVAQETLFFEPDLEDVTPPAWTTTPKAEELARTLAAERSVAEARVAQGGRRRDRAPDPRQAWSGSRGDSPILLVDEDEGQAQASKDQAEAIARDIDCVVGMSSAVGDLAAIRFSTAFYQALAFGSSVAMAFNLACAQIDLEDLDEGNTPQLVAFRRDPEEIVFVEEG